MSQTSIGGVSTDHDDFDFSELELEGQLLPNFERLESEEEVDSEDDQEHSDIVKERAPANGSSHDRLPARKGLEDFTAGGYSQDLQSIPQIEKEEERDLATKRDQLRYQAWSIAILDPVFLSQILSFVEYQNSQKERGNPLSWRNFTELFTELGPKDESNFQQETGKKEKFQEGVPRAKVSIEKAEVQERHRSRLLSDKLDQLVSAGDDIKYLLKSLPEIEVACTAALIVRAGALIEKLGFSKKFLKGQLKRYLESSAEEIARNAPRHSSLPTLAQESHLMEVDHNKKLAEGNLRFVVWLAWKRLRFGLSVGLGLDDLIQEGNMGLMKAIQSFDIGMDVRLGSYASRPIIQAMDSAIRKKGRGNPVSYYTAQIMRRLNVAGQQFYQLKGYEPDESQLSELVYVPPGKISEIRRTLRKPLRLDATVGAGESLYLKDAIPDKSVLPPDAQVMEKGARAALDEMLTTLNPKQLTVMELRYGLKDGTDRTLEKVGEILGLSRERIRQIEEAAMIKLRNFEKRRRIRVLLGK